MKHLNPFLENLAHRIVRGEVSAIKVDWKKLAKEEGILDLESQMAQYIADLKKETARHGG